MDTITTASEGLRVQRDYIKQLEDAQFSWDILVGDAFVRGMRDIGYKSTAFAMSELIDNSIQANAKQIDIVFGFESGNMPSHIAIIDDGYGMEPTMVRASLVWGAGTRAENRDGFGKYGYGLPSASVSQCHRVSVYSKTADGAWNTAYLDIDEIKDHKWTKDGRIEMPSQTLAEPPEFVVDYLKKANRWSSFVSGTVVVWEGLDRTDYKQREKLRADLLTNLGVIYRNYLTATPMTVDGETVQPCDPLFLTEGFRYYDLDEDRAIALDPAVVDVTDKKTGEVIGRMRVRFSRLPATFFRKPDAKHTNKPGRGNMNPRLEIADANNGVIFLRNGRQIDVVRPPRSLASFNATTDRFWGIEVDFDATLDEFFSITTSKQQVKPDERVWDILKDKANIWSAIGAMRSAYQKDAATHTNKTENSGTERRASVEAIEAAEQRRITPKPKDTPVRLKEAADNFEQSANRRARQSGLKPEFVQLELEAERTGQAHKVETEDMPGAAFFRCVQEGGTRVLYLNVAHPFYTELYQGPGSNPRFRAGLEVLLWTLGNAEVDSDPDSPRRAFYEQERAFVWSATLTAALNTLKLIDLSVVEKDDSATDETGAADAA
ncbi:hypothetical protein E4P41_08600 [Geodermatophilus sp. DF01-2]|uniref:ATP-binding protein n=1 Tax=Geodermatophilus sp. DF01-2 TaxID=2559610 RepID=UPI00107359ED|nr:ATP-binding protein [Geodermatophilus sp. DF01_2]TFV62049.1 hypothetical protein E4P41_08600 [Geodermatophilus sp. DF01_2]